jgi:hypothetical protein
MSVNIRDQNGSNIGGLNVTYYITMNGQGAGAVWDSPSVYSDHYKQTNSQGNVSYNFTAGLNCDNESTPLVDEEYEVGPHSWYVIVNSTSQCYKPLASYSANSYYEFTTIDQLNGTIVSPTSGATIEQGRQNITILTYIYNFCQEPMTISTSNVTFNLSTGSTGYLCTPVERIGANVYQCEWDTLNRTNGWYKFNFTSWATYYYTDTEIKANAFQLQTKPLLKEANASPRSESWSSPKNFSVRVTDNLGDTVNVTLYIAVGAAEVPYQTKCCGPLCPSNPYNCSSTMLQWNNIYLNDTYPCTTYADKTASFWFEATDTEAYTYTTSVPPGDYVDDDNTVYFEKAETRIDYVAGNNSQATPILYANFSVRVFDLDNQTFIYSQAESTHPLVYFNVTKTEGDPASSVFVNSTRAGSTGYANTTFLPDGTFSTGNQTWFAYIGDADICYSYNRSGNLTVNIQEINWPPLYRNMTVNGLPTTSMQWGAGGFNFSVEVKDYGTEGGNVNVTLLIDTGDGWEDMGTQTCYSCSSWNQTNFTDIHFACDDINSSARFMFTLEDNLGNPNSTSISTFGIDRDNVVFEIQSGHGPTAIANRTAARDNLTMQVRIRDENGTYLSNLSTTLYISQLGTLGAALWDSGQILYTNATGYITHNFTTMDHCDNESTPYEEEEYEVGPHWWYVKDNSNEICFKQTNSTAEPDQNGYYNFTTIGQLSNTIVSPTGGSIIQQGRANVSISSYIYNECGEPMKISASSVTFNLSTTGIFYLCSDKQILGENVYVCTWDTLNRTDGTYNFTMTSSTDNYYTDTELEEDAFILRTIPMLKEANLTYRTESWTIPRNYSVRVTDNLGDTVNVTLYISVGASEEAYGTLCCGPLCPSNPYNCSSTRLTWDNINLNSSYACSVYADKTARFYFVAEDSETYEYTTSIPTGDYVSDNENIYLQKANVRIEYGGSGNASFATPSTPSAFSLRVYDTDNQTYLFTQPESDRPLVYFNVTTTEGDWSTRKYVNGTRADGTGHANLTFLPDISFNPGNQTWLGYISSSDLCYSYNQSANFTVDVDVNWPPLYRNMTVNQKATDGKGWGGYWNFSVEVRDFGTESDNLDVTLQVDTGSGWKDYGTQQCLSCSSWKQINFTNLTFSCGNITSSAKFRFNITDQGGNTNGTGTYTTFSILPDNILITHVEGNNSISNRSGSQTRNLTLNFFDTNNQTYLPAGMNVTYWVSWNYYAFDDGHLLQTDSNGNITMSFNPGCTSPQYAVGAQRWYAKVNTTETCYYANQSDYYDLTVMGEFNITVFKPDGSSNYTWGESIFMQGQVKDDCGNTIDAASVSFNMTEGTYNYGFAPSNLGGGFYQGDWDSTNASEGYYNVTMMVNKTSFYQNQSVIRPPLSFYLYTVPLLKYANATPRTNGWGATYNFTVKVTDEAGDNVTVAAETKRFGYDYTQVGSSQNCTSCSNFTMWWNESYTCDLLSGNPTRNFRFTGVDDATNIRITSTLSGDYVDNDNSYVLEKDDIQVMLVSGNGNMVNRSSGNTTFIILINDTDRGVSVRDFEATVRLNVTTNTTRLHKQDG